jgi:hypothetical protein
VKGLGVRRVREPGPGLGGLIEEREGEQAGSLLGRTGEESSIHEIRFMKAV